MHAYVVWFLAWSGLVDGFSLVDLQPTVQDTIAWGPCAGVETSDPHAECAFVEMPLLHGSSDGRTIGVAVKRILASDESTRQLWFLDGGPGDAGSASLERLATVLADPHLDVYTADHRGVGGTALLSCPDQQAPDSPDGSEITSVEWAVCMDHIRATRSDLDGLTATETARDLGRLIEMTRESGKRVFVMGASYGTFLANRYLQLFPNQPDGVILDGIVPPDWSFVEFDAGLDRTGRRLLARCGRDPDCAAHLTPDPEIFAEEVLRKLRDGHCGQIGLTASLTRLILGISLMIDRIPLAYVPPLIERIGRCEWHDQMVLLHLFRVLDGLSEPASHSPVLQRHVALSELWREDAPPSDALERALDDYVMTTEVSASFSRTVDSWPTYDPSPYDGAFADYDGPMLMMHGSMDPTMSVERLTELRSVFSSPNQTFAVVPDAGHVVVSDSECAQSIYLAFLDAPRLVPDTTCLSSAPRLDFAGNDSTSVALFGTADMWGDQVGVVRTFLFHLAYRYQTLLFGIMVPVVGVFSVRRRLARSAGSATRRPYGIIAASVGIWLLSCAGFWFAAFVLPLLLPYNAVSTVAIVMGVALLHVAVGYWLIRRIDARYASVV